MTMAVVDQLTRLPRIGRLLSHVHMPADEAQLPAEEMSAWHTYAVEWKPDGLVFSMDGKQVLSSRLALPGRMAAVAWVDNNYASFGPDGGIVMGNLDVRQRQWMEIEYLAVEPLKLKPGTRAGQKNKGTVGIRLP